MYKSKEVRDKKNEIGAAQTKFQTTYEIDIGRVSAFKMHTKELNK